MPDLKEVLFHHAFDYYTKYQNFKHILGEKNELTIQCENKWYGCSFVIRDSGLEAEYDEWVKKQKNRSGKNARVVVNIFMDIV